MNAPAKHVTRIAASANGLREAAATASASWASEAGTE